MCPPEVMKNPLAITYNCQSNCNLGKPSDYLPYMNIIFGHNSKMFQLSITLNQIYDLNLD